MPCISHFNFHNIHMLQVIRLFFLNTVLLILKSQFSAYLMWFKSFFGSLFCIFLWFCRVPNVYEGDVGMLAYCLSPSGLL